MTGRARGLMIAAVAFSLLAVACGGDRGTVEVPGREGQTKSAAFVRADRRAYDGAPPTIPHEDFGTQCISCHNREGVDVPDVGYAPASPHALTEGLSETSRCRQCHVFRTTGELFRPNEFVGLVQDLRRGARLHGNAPPTIPHKVLMRENCIACHSGPAAREEIRTSHPERTRCRQCHVPVTTLETLTTAGVMP